MTRRELIRLLLGLINTPRCIHLPLQGMSLQSYIMVRTTAIRKADEALLVTEGHIFKKQLILW